MERQENVFAGYKPSSPIRDYTETPNVIEQGVVDPKVLERINKAERGELKARLAAILDRGIIQDRLHVELPEGIHGEWVRNDPLEIRRLKGLGFVIDEEYAPSRAIHSDGTNSGIVGDVIHMIVPQEVKDVLDEIIHENIIRTHTKRRVGRVDLNKEDLEFMSSSAGESSVTPYSSSTEKMVTPNDINDILNSIDDQTGPR